MKSMEGGGYKSAAYRTDMQHLYYHLNIAWNSRDAGENRIRARRGEDFKKWRGFPADLYLQEGEGLQEAASGD
ncbi:MAG: hypothetical protein ACM3WV_00130 [Bacillota bacterium]